MKTHARNTAVGGILLPIALLIATAVANLGQSLLGLELDRVSLAIYLVPFLYGSAELMKALMKLEATRVADSFSKSFLDGFGHGAQGKEPVVTFVPPPPGQTEHPPPPPAAPPGMGGGA